MDEIEVYNQLSAIATPTFAVTFGDDSDQAIRIAEHKAWLGSIRRERPGTNTPYKVGIYIRYFNQTKYDNYAFHEVAMFDESSMMEKEANLFAAEFLMNDKDVLRALNRDTTFFSAASMLRVPAELLDFKFRVMKWKGYKLVEPPINASSNFLRDMEVPENADYDD